MTITLNRQVNFSMLEQLIDSVNKLKDNEKLIIYFSSLGGYADSCEAIVDFINNNKERIEIIFFGENFSCGMLIFLNIKCKKTVLSYTTGMMHLCSQSTTITGVTHTNDYNKFNTPYLEKFNKEMGEKYKKVMTKKEIRDMLSGVEIYFDTDRMKKLCSAEY